MQSSSREMSKIRRSQPIYVRTDASGIGLSAILANFIGGKERPVCYVSRILQPNEKNLHAMEQELLAIIWEIPRVHIWSRVYVIH